jgi:threonine/homoserine/homoserine lactone efflux protein
VSAASVADVAALGAQAAVIALSGAMAPGPYLTLTISRTVRVGPRSALLMLVGHALLEGALIIGFAFGLQTVLRHPVVIRGLSLAGGAFLLWMGFDLLRGAWSGSIAKDLEVAEGASRMGPVTEGALVSLSNPYWLLWWVTIGAALVAQGLAMGPVGVLAFYAGHQLGDVVWYAFVIIAIAKGRHLLPPRVYRGIMGSLALFLLALGIRFALVGAGMLAVG